MRVKISGYEGRYKILSLALDEKTKDDLLSESVDLIYVDRDGVLIYPEEYVLSKEESVIKALQECNNYDVFELYENGILYRYYDDSSNDNTFFITGKCNSNCIMCPSSDIARQRDDLFNIQDLISIASHIPSETEHITITGGEPFMVGKELFDLLFFCREKFKKTDFLILTNARIFAIDEYCRLLSESIPESTTIGIPLHGSCSEIHDAITRTDKSFVQTMMGLKKLHALGIKTEIRIVVMKQNLLDLDRIAELIVSQLINVDHVNIMAMEMTGNAAKNSDMIWVPYRESFKFVKKMILKLVTAGIDVRLYNFPLCTVEREFWMICQKSISEYKVRFAEVCSSCRMKDSCGGVFAGTLRLESNDLEAIC